MKIRITRGVYGHREKGRIVEKTKDHEPFEVGDEEGMRLISMGVAEEITGGIPEDGWENKSDPSLMLLSANAGMDTEEYRDEDSEYIPVEQLEEMKAEELRSLAGEMGLKRSGSREELIDRIMQAQELHIEEKGAEKLNLQAAEFE